MLKSRIKPSEIDRSDHFWDSDFQNSEAETVASVLIYCLEKMGDSFERKFTYEEIKDNVVNRGHLDFVSKWLQQNDDGTMEVTEEFVRVVCKFMK